MGGLAPAADAGACVNNAKSEVLAERAPSAAAAAAATTQNAFKRARTQCCRAPPTTLMP